jgi:hypothetical protein
MSEMGQLIVAGSGEADSHRPSLFEAKVRATVRYADPAAWITATAVAGAIEGAGDLLAEWRHEIGMISISDQGPAGAMTDVQAEATQGFSSPLRYLASSPGTLAGVSCIAFGLRGPTLNLTMTPQDGVSVALTMCAGWLARKAARLMIVATCRTTGSTTKMSRAVLLAPPGFSRDGKPLTESATSWLVAYGLGDGANA